MHAKTAVFADGVNLDIAPIRMMERLTDAGRQMDVSGGAEVLRDTGSGKPLLWERLSP